MRRALLPALLAVSLLLAGCAVRDDPGESTLPEESTGPPPGPDDGTIPGFPAGEPASTTPPPDAPTPVEPTPVAPPPPPAPTPAPVTPTPPTPPAPTPATPTPTPPPPSPTPTPPPPPPTAWPREGSAVRYEVVVLSGSPDGYYNQDTFSNWTWTYRDGDWTGVCEGERVFGPYEEEQQREPISATVTAANPPHWPPMNTRSPPAVGEEVTAWRLSGCQIGSGEEIYRGIDDGMHHATDVESPVPYDYVTHWDRETGLVVAWDQWGRYTHSWGELKSRT